MIEKAFEENSINVVFSTNNKYAYYMIVALQSLITNASPDRKYDVIILETDIVQETKDIISEMQKDNISIRFVNTESLFEKPENKDLFTHLYFSKEMYLRIFIPEILNNYDKAIYLDCDTIIQSDLAELFDTDINDYYLAAVKDYNSIVNFRQYPNVKLYFEEAIKIPDINSYFNSGVLLMNLNKLREIKLSERAFEHLKIHQKLLYPDQDLLNIVCAGNVKILDNGWNFVFAINPALVQNNYFIPQALEWTKGLGNQKVIHYISENKPWNTPEMAYADIWWEYAKYTKVYQPLLKDYFTAHPEKLAQSK